MKADGSFWFSKISDSQTCLRLYRYKHIDKVKLEEELSADLEFGTAMHAALHQILKGGDGEAAFTSHWEFARDLGLDYGRLQHDQLREIGLRLLTRFKRLHAKKFKPFKMEERAFATIEGLSLEGTPDFVGEFEGVPSIVDYKTSAYRYDKQKIVCDAQMPLYARLAELAWGYAVQQRVYVVFVKDAKDPSIQIIKSPLTPMIVNDSIVNVIETCQDLQNRKSFPMNTKACVVGARVCPFFSTCFRNQGVNE